MLRLRCFAPIPRPRGRGPIEARINLSCRSESVSIPRPRGRGPIEAFSKERFAHTVREFRARAGAAPLKPRVPADAGRESELIPRPRGRGPIEALMLV